jgi:outer membrane protein assembly factor BamA
LNAELRVPVAKYFSSKPLTSSFWRNFQLVGFFDAGTAWHGSNPFRRDNPLNTIFLPKDANQNTAVTIKINYFKDPIVASYGLGARVLVFGYMVRADYGWGIETREIQKPMLHIALGTDF